MSSKGSQGLIIHKEKILLILRDNNPNIPNPNVWQPPGGQAENRETPIKTFKRELFEEIGIIPNIIREFKKIGENFTIFASHLSDEEVSKIKLGNEGQKLKFFSLQEAKELPLTPNAKLFIEKYWNEIKEEMCSQLK